jgi:hypothetical protein
MNELERIRKQSWPDKIYCSGICLEGLKKTTKNINQDRRFPVRDLNPGPPEYEVRVLNDSVVIFCNNTHFKDLLFSWTSFVFVLFPVFKFWNILITNVAEELAIYII